MIPRKQDPNEPRVNERIRVPQIRLIGAGGEQLGIVNPQEGMRIARENTLDLVEVAPAARPPVCRVMDFSKYKYEQAKKSKEARKHQRSTHLKEIRVRPHIEDHDYHTKLKFLEKFLKRGDKVKVTLVFRGREMAHQEFGKRVLDRFMTDLSPLANVEKAPIQEGRMIFLTFAPKA
ncbi:MAG: translation initiation factor IF-3 [Candidatus Omnitrophica bacterium]|nr:translation initiation factor IF-3 [Candidatus Omnitrophota bacterium]